MMVSIVPLPSLLCLVLKTAQERVFAMQRLAYAAATQAFWEMIAVLPMQILSVQEVVQITGNAIFKQVILMNFIENKNILIILGCICNPGFTGKSCNEFPRNILRSLKNAQNGTYLGVVSGKVIYYSFEPQPHFLLKSLPCLSTQLFSI